MKPKWFDIFFIVTATTALLVLNALNYLDYVMKYPLIVILVAYFIGRYVNGLIVKSRTKEEEVS